MILHFYLNTLIVAKVYILQCSNSKTHELLVKAWGQNLLINYGYIHFVDIRKATHVTGSCLPCYVITYAVSVAALDIEYHLLGDSSTNMEPYITPIKKYSCRPYSTSMIQDEV